MQWLIADFIMERRFHWLGNLGCMSDDRLLKQLLFGELQRKQPFPKKQWHDLVLSHQY